jgi:hypothetical protein
MYRHNKGTITLTLKHVGKNNLVYNNTL